MMIDLLIYETGNGGDVKLENGDLVTTDSLSNQVYLAQFGGNKEAVTTGEEIEGNERFDWWGNFLFINEPEAMMNSHLEKALIDNPLTSSGRSEIERRAEEDLDFLNELGEVSVVASIISNDKIRLSESISEIETDYQYLWDATKGELIYENQI